MVATIAPSRVTRPETPDRWARALDRALHGGVEIFTTISGERFATSSTHHDLLYRVTPNSCDCAAGLSGDPICMHRAALRSILGTLPVVTVRIDEMIPADAPRCAVCSGRGEYLAGCPLDDHNPSRVVTCPECGGTGCNLAAILRVVDTR